MLSFPLLEGDLWWAVYRLNVIVAHIPAFILSSLMLLK